MRRGTEPHAYLPLKPLVFLTLLVLRQREAHGYAIKKEVAQRSEGAINLEPGTLYRLLARLLDQGLIEDSNRRPVAEADDERRRYYRLTPLGRDVVAAEATRLTRLVDTEDVRSLISEGRG